MTVIEEAFVKAGFKPLKSRKPRQQKEIKCHRCGAVMDRVSSTNIVVCSGEIKDKNGEVQLTSCTNRIIFKN